MALDLVEHWMERNLSWLKERNLDAFLFLPGSHDAGTHRNIWKTEFGHTAVNRTRGITRASGAAVIPTTHWSIGKAPWGYSSPVICVYGGQRITDSGVLSNIETAIVSHNTFHVDNKGMRTDPCGGTKKSCGVYYVEYKNINDGLFGKGRFAFDDQDLDFRMDLDMIYWGNKVLTQRAYCIAYWNLFKVIET
ncbi:hypothetical protein MMC14_010093, partial [Varicellaria rhodocarpa]|nr:hypothetical protein [Varicellaria rhodocarpa]